MRRSVEADIHQAVENGQYGFTVTIRSVAALKSFTPHWKLAFAGPLKILSKRSEYPLTAFGLEARAMQCLSQTSYSQPLVII